MQFEKQFTQSVVPLTQGNSDKPSPTPSLSGSDALTFSHLSSGHSWLPEKPRRERFFMAGSSLNLSGSNLQKTNNKQIRATSGIRNLLKTMSTKTVH